MKNILMSTMLLLSTACNAQEVINNPSAHENMIAGITWENKIIPHKTEYPYENCNSSNPIESQCWIALSEGVAFPFGTTSVNVSVKSKAWYKGSPYESTCILYGYMLTSSTEVGNHFIHSEVFSFTDTSRDNRRISYVNLKIPVVNGAVKIGVGKQLDEGCSVSFAVYLDGYSIPASLQQ